MDIYEETQLITADVLCLKITKLYAWLDVGDYDREKYNLFDLEQLDELCSVLQKNKEYREKEIEDRRIAKKMQ